MWWPSSCRTVFRISSTVPPRPSPSASIGLWNIEILSGNTAAHPVPFAVDQRRALVEAQQPVRSVAVRVVSARRQLLLIRPVLHDDRDVVQLLIDLRRERLQRCGHQPLELPCASCSKHLGASIDGGEGHRRHIRID